MFHTTHHRYRCQLNHQQGMTLIEVLISMLIFSFVLLGVASAQLVSISGARDANMRSIAAFSAASLAAVIRSNSAFWEGLDTDFDVTIATVTDGSNGAVSAGYSSTADLSDYDLTLTESGCNLDDGECTAAEIATSDLQRWSSAWVTSVFSGEASISNIAAAGETPLFKITLSWRQKQMTETGDADDSAGILVNQYETLVKM